MTEWFSEAQTEHLEIRVAYDAVLCRQRSRYQEIAVYQTRQFGRVLTLDDIIMTTETDEFAYHEMLVHPALLACPQPRSVLIVGGGDGGAVREVLRHPTVEEVVVAELDPEVIRVCRRFLPWAETAFGDPRVRVRAGDGAAFVAAQERDSFDAVLVDAPDPVGFAQVLFGVEFYTQCRRILAPSGVLAVQSDSPYTMPAITRKAVSAIATLFPTTRLCYAVVPTYAGNLWTFTLGSLNQDPAREPAPERAAVLAGCRYWSPRAHGAAFAVPAFVEQLAADAGAVVGVPNASWR